MGAPQIIWIILSAMSVGMALIQHGKPETGRQNAWVSIAAAAIVNSLLYWGGFFA
jgi:hypothetical protein